ncbi:hypothetical protein [Shimazuella kribbensis]|uniref:hypothetical protein n=1 Tax=Shimazuella kribbensis TaxID=139808 RepID=UPI000491689B|nr:hypothetical protein [Shimazuella kribbensis]
MNGLWHRVFTCIVINSENRTMLLQKKSPSLYTFDRPNYVDVAVGGHYVADERIEDGAAVCLIPNGWSFSNKT